MKIYVILSFEQDDVAELVMAFTDETKANEFCDALLDKVKDGSGLNYFVQEVELKQ
jgi:hypothetical protein